MTNYRPFLIIALVLLVAAAGTALLLKSNQRVDSSRDTNTESSDNAKKNLSADAVVTLEEFGDYQCPPCGQLHPTLKKLKQEYGANLNFIFRNLPLTKIHHNALAAAQAAEAARVQNRFWEMHDLLYENQSLWKDDINPRSIFTKFAADLGLNITQFVRDLDGQQIQMRIEADEDAAAKQGIDGTPTILINGRQLRAEMTTPDGVRKGIEVMLSAKATPSR
ncbi:MAG: formate-nitrite transporter family protein [Pyrinomonadaceae bacterium]|jgi:protein-disulfide isomerase|nr:formate-nitrite transporter family protein [Pyrinomonadaceae bacterium]